MNLSELLFLNEVNLVDLIRTDPDVKQLAGSVSKAQFNQWREGGSGGGKTIRTDDDRFDAFFDGLMNVIAKHAREQKPRVMKAIRNASLLQPPKGPNYPQKTVQSTPPPLPKSNIAQKVAAPSPFRKTEMAPAR